MLGYIILLGLLAITTVLLVNRWVLALLLIPGLYLGYWFTTAKVPDYFGYPVAVEFLDIPEARVLDAFQGDKIYVLLMIKGDKEPRLISMETTEQNKKTLKELSTKLKSGGVVIKKKGSDESQPSGVQGEQSDSEGDLKIVPIEEQTIFRKDSDV
ncbi:hypothetical protein EVB99_067 [Rhizobium phage RHph_N3_19]|nr:hypothetical protein EVB99_067 [Rhizobium phage RHph_N3_19]